MSSTKKSEEKVLTMRDLEERFTKVVSLALEKGYVINFPKSSAANLLLYTRNKKLPPILHIYMCGGFLSNSQYGRYRIKTGMDYKEIVVEEIYDKHLLYEDLRTYDKTQVYSERYFTYPDWRGEVYCKSAEEIRKLRKKQNERYARILDHYYENLSKKLSQKQLKEIVMKILKKKRLFKSWFEEVSIEECTVEILEYGYLRINFPAGKRNRLLFNDENWDVL